MKSHPRALRCFASCFTALCLLAAASAAEPDRPAPARPKTRLATDGTRFTINGKPAFLLGVSVYGALGTPPEALARDLDDLQQAGFNWLRVWATWRAFDNDVSAVDAEGRPREPFLSRLGELVAECDARGLIVDVTLSRGNSVAGAPGLQSLAAHRRAVETIVEALKDRGNWYLDLSNERNIGDARHTSFDDLRTLRADVRRLDPSRLVTASHGGDMSRDEVKKYVEKAGVDFLAPHRPRHARTASETAAKTREYLDWLKELGRALPVHYQEPFRRGYQGDWEPAAADFLADLEAARDAGAAGWCFHNGAERGTGDGRPRRGFDLRDVRLLEQLDAEERKLLEELKARRSR